MSAAIRTANTSHNRLRCDIARRDFTATHLHRRLWGGPRHTKGALLLICGRRRKCRSGLSAWYRVLDCVISWTCALIWPNSGPAAWPPTMTLPAGVPMGHGPCAEGAVLTCPGAA